MAVPLLDLKAQYASIKEEILKEISEISDSQYFILGPKVEKLEKEVAAYCASNFAVGVTSGSDALIIALMVEGIGPGDEVIVPAPYWVSYTEMIKAAGATAVIVKCRAENNYELEPEQLQAAITPRTKLLILNSPSNPTGAVYRVSTIEKIAEIALKNNIMVMSDEIYEKLVYDPEFRHKSIASVSPEMNELTITINGFSKAYSMPGWRLGYLAAPKWLADRIIAFQSHTTSNPTSFAQYGALAALTGTQEPVEQMRQAFAKRRDLIYSLISAIPGIKTIRPSGAFYLFFDVSSFGLNSTDFVNRLLEEEKVAGVPGKAFGDDHSLRVSYACSEETIREAAARIARFCEKLSR